MISEDMVRVAGVATLGSDAGRDATREDGRNPTPISKRRGTAGATRASTVAWHSGAGREEKKKRWSWMAGV
jgi:hypothetical protein